MENITVDRIADSLGAVSIAVPLVVDVYTHSHDIKDVSNLVLFYKATVTAGAPDIDLYVQQSFGLPTTEGVIGDTLDGWITIGAKIADITDENWHYVVVSPVVVPYLRFFLDPQGANPASCTVDLRLGRQGLID